jgi:hypothetical protein
MFHLDSRQKKGWSRRYRLHCPRILEKRVESMGKFICRHGLITDGWISVDPADTGVIEKLFKKDIREKEERLMLAVLESAVEDFQKYVLARKPRGKKLFQEAEEWFQERDSDELFSFENICETLQLHPDYIRQGLMSGRKQSSRRFLLRIIIKVAAS